jgi:hypothetical protein
MKAAKKEDEPAIIAEITRVSLKLAELEKTPFDGYIESDTTIEALVVSSAKGGPKIIVDEEGSFIRNITGRYSKSPNLDYVKKAWSGEPHTYRRRNSGDVAYRIPYPILTIAAGLQPEACRALGGLFGGSLRGEGFLARFLFASPPSRIGDLVAPSARDSASPLKRAYSDFMLQQIKVHYKSEPTLDKAWIIRLSEESLVVWQELFEWLDKKAATEFMALRDWLKKASDHAVRIAALLTLAKGVKTREATIKEPEMRVAVTMIKNYFLYHVAHVCDMFRDSDTNDQFRILLKPLIKWLKERKEKSVNLRFIQRAGRPTNLFRNAKTEEIRQAMEILEERGLVIGSDRMSKRGKLTTKSWILTHNAVEEDD